MVGEISKNSMKEKGPCFFKIILPGYTTHHMRIPPKFLKHIMNEMPERATLKLKASSDCSWHVRVRKTSDGVYFKEGWQEFLKDNSLNGGDFLLFTYNGNMHFSIQIFDKSACERDEITNSDSAHENLTSANGKRPRGRPNKFKPSKDNSGSSEPDELKEDEEEDYKDSKAKCSGAFKSRFPHFKGIRYQRGQMAFPTSFSRKHLSPGKSEVLTLKDSKGTQWKVKIVPSSGTHFFSEGWSAFAKANQIEVGDACMFELVSRNKMVVHIFRE